MKKNFIILLVFGCFLLLLDAGNVSGFSFSIHNINLCDAKNHGDTVEDYARRVRHLAFLANGGYGDPTWDLLGFCEGYSEKHYVIPISLFPDIFDIVNPDNWGTNPTKSIPCLATNDDINGKIGVRP